MLPSKHTFGGNTSMLLPPAAYNPYRMHASGTKPFFGRNTSVLLDLLRFGAAVVVALSHMPLHFVNAQPFLSERAGNTAVCVFFVLSGFVIRYITVARVQTPGAYWIDRVSRIYSVVAPCLALTVLLEGAAFRDNFRVYSSLTPVFPWSDVPRQLAEALTFTVGWWGYGRIPLSNGPFWSLPFECVYYVLYGVMFFLPRLRWWLLPLLLFAVGPAIALLFPIWLLGVVLYDAYASLHRRRHGIAVAFAGLGVLVVVLLLLRPVITAVLEATTIGRRQAVLTAWVLHWPAGHALLQDGLIRWLDRFSPSYFLSGILLTAGLLPLLLALDAYLPEVPSNWARRIRLVADSTFTLYLVHVPFFLLVDTVAGGPVNGWFAGGLLLFSAIVLSTGLARVFDWLKNVMRAGLRRSSARWHAEPVAP